MTSMSALWLPILLSSVIVFVVSSIIHMFSPWHKSDYPKLANEDQVMDALRPLVTGPGDYMMPRPSSMEEMKSAAFKAKVERGPRIIMTVTPGGPMTMSREMVMWFLYLIVVNVLTAYIAAHALAPGALQHPDHSLHRARFVHRICIGALAALHLVSPLLDDHLQVDDRCADIRCVDGADLRVSVAARVSIRAAAF